MYVSRHKNKFIKSAQTPQRRRPPVIDFQNEIVEMFVRREGEEEGVENGRGRRFIKWAFDKRLRANQTAAIMRKLRQNINQTFYIRHSYSYVLVNNETGLRMVFYKQQKGSPWINNFAEAERWVNEQENKRLNIDNIERPNTKWTFIKFSNIEVKVVLDNQPMLGTGPLPDWLRNLAHGRKMISLDTYGDNLCVWRCIAVYRGSRPDRCTQSARQLARGFFKSDNVPRTCLGELDKVEQYLNKEKQLREWMGIRVYEPERQENGEIYWRLIRNPSDKLKNIMTIGIHEDHAFLIKDIAKLAKIYVCNDCQNRFTKACNLQRHAETCSQGETEIKCPEQKVKKPLTKYEEAFSNNGKTSPQCLEWLEKEEKRLGLHIHHALCGHGGERCLLGSPVDGFEPSSRTVYEFHGCFFHGCPRCIKTKRDETKMIGKTPNQLYHATRTKTAALRRAGFKVVEKWGCEYHYEGTPLPAKKNEQYPHFIFYDFEALHDKSQAGQPTSRLTYEAVHVPISVSIGDTKERKPTFIVDRDPKQLVARFMEEIARRGDAIRDEVKAKHMPPTGELGLSNRAHARMLEWCTQVPVVGFNSGRYDLNLIKEYFVEELAELGNVHVGKKANTTMFIKTPASIFLDIINYLGPGTSYDSWIKAYGASAQKAWLPYEWLDSPDKLDFPGLPDYIHWYSKLKGEYVLKLSEYIKCRKLFCEKGMRTFRDWLEYYNNLDVGPGLEALEKMRSFYFNKGIDILKDAVSLPGVSLHYLLRGALERGEEFWSPSSEAYNLLKKGMVGGPSIVFKRYHEAGVTKIRPHRVKKPKTCAKIIGYDTNALYLSAMARDMPGGKGEVVVYDNPQEGVERVRNPDWFGFAEVDIQIPKILWGKFEEMPPFFYNKQISEKAVPSHMKAYRERTGRTQSKSQKLVGALSAEKMLVYAPLLRWYLDHGAELLAVYRTIDYKKASMQWFVDEVTEARRAGDADKSKTLLADVFKLLGNSCYGKMIENVASHNSTRYTKDEKLVDRILRSAYFEDLNEIGAAYELTSRKRSVTINRPYQIGIAVYQLAKLRMLEFR